ncbi:MAG: recombination protein RecR [Magnetococcales bacterium]|nr:recombination protein RecR [Magnetococcales bacterium]MBF0323084.1 recombination protein RecR [Magnetococcales bacterium]
MRDGETKSGLPSVAKAVEMFSRFPGVGRKSAQRMVQHLLRRERSDMDLLILALEGLRDKVRPCTVCFNLAEGKLCWICADQQRDQNTLCLLEETSDLLAMEKAGAFRGVYHVLGGRLSPLDGVGPEDLHFATLTQRLQQRPVRELIIATNPTVEGEATAHYAVQIAQPLVGKVTRLAYGLPMGGELEYLDESTLYQALAGRREF